jgi:radical SAM protein with 4Fe4S-binding SPASM domain
MESIFARARLPYRKIEGYSIAHIGEKKIFFNHTGTKIWSLVDGQRTAPEIARALVRDLNAQQSSFQVTSSQVESFLNKLSAIGLVRKIEPGVGSEHSKMEDPAQLAAQSRDGRRRRDADGSKGTLRAVQEICMTPKLVAQDLTSVEQQIDKLYWDKHYIQKMHVELTYRCNFRCVHCYNTTHGGGATELKTDEWRRALDQMADLGCWLITFTGGEVFVRRDLVSILEHACERGFSIRLNTNGSLINENAIKQLEPMRPFLQSFDISVYGADAIVHDALAQRPGGYADTMRALSLLHDAGLPVVSKFVTMQGNFDGIEKFEADMERLGIPHTVHTGAVIPQTNRNTQPLVQLLTDAQYKKLMATRSVEGVSRAGNCKPGHIRGAITPDGYVSPCEWLTDFKYGNLREHSLREIWYSSGFLAWRRKFQEGHSECPTCELRPGCSRCPAHSYLETGDIFKCAPIQRHYSEICKEIGAF